MINFLEMIEMLLNLQNFQIVLNIANLIKMAEEMV